MDLNSTYVDWGYLAEILAMMVPEQPQFPIEGLLEHEDARLYSIDNQRDEEEFGLLDAPSQPITQQERQDIEAGYARLHIHTNLLLDLGFIDQHDRDEAIRRIPDTSPWRYGYEVWPRRITARGYFFLEAIGGTEESNSGVLQSLQKASTMVATEAIKHGVSEIVKALGSAIG